ARTSAPWTGVGDQAIAIGADRQGSIYLAYVDPTLAMDIDQEPCYARVDGMHWCARSSSPVPPLTYLYVEKFSADGVSLGKVPLTFPFSSWSPAGATTIEFANHGRGAEGISSLLGGGVRLTAIIGHEDVNRQANPGAGVALTGIV